ncbi:chemotaxis protein CheB [Flavobacterium crassostreae]|uniref:protein-glutamate methylesterase n=1 Tax=Flavobacterium crassostreae TaxID=1763534 RepID=A0A1B9DYR5_9FLAO|nr:chemotaxis protein CheB [Flavobacterium crassostreae]OCB74832.1 chemotaxis protein CheB [Flavobacterium crassostreae]
MEKNKRITHFDAVVLGGSAGSLHVLMEILPKLKANAPFALVIVVHRTSSADSMLENLIALKTSMQVKEVEDKTPILPGSIYIAPANYHLLFEKNKTISLDISEKINFSRPSIDVSFQSLAEVYKNSLLGILLSGANADGTKGLLAIHKAGGTTIVQNPLEAEMPFMPQHALLQAHPDHTLNTLEISNFLLDLV